MEREVSSTVSRAEAGGMAWLNAESSRSSGLERKEGIVFGNSGTTDS